MRAGVTIVDPRTTSIDADAAIGADTTIEPGVVLKGATVIGGGCTIGAGTTIDGATIADGVTIRHSFIDQAVIEDGVTVGPFAYLRPGTLLRERSKIGTFVEVKNSDIGEGTKIPHLSYIGDADVGPGSNLGAGSITANYDGANKHRTTIGADAHIGSNCVLVAPVEIGAGATIGGGSTIAKAAPAGELTIARARQTTLRGWKRPVKVKR